MASYRCELEKLTGVANYDYVGSVHGQLGNIGRPVACHHHPVTAPHGRLWMKRGIPVIKSITSSPAHSSWPGKLLSWATAADPDIVLVHLGTVDLTLTLHYSVASTVPRQSARSIDTLRAANPFVRIVLAQILPASNDGVDGTPLATVTEFNALLPALVASKARPSSPIVLVDMNTDFTVKLHTADGVHPNPNGENKMAGRWKTAIDQIMAIEVTLYSTYIPKVSR